VSLAELGAGGRRFAGLCEVRDDALLAANLKGRDGGGGGGMARRFPSAA